MANEQTYLEEVKLAIIDGDDKASAVATQDALQADVDPLAIRR